MLNNIIIMGRLTADPELKSTENSQFCRFSIATDRPKKKGKDNFETDFFNCISWNSLAKVVNLYYHKGDMIVLGGHLRNNKYQKDDKLHVSDEKPSMTYLIMTACMNGKVSPELVKSAIRHCDDIDVDYIPADLNLAGSETMMSTALSRETILRRILSEEISRNYDFILIDSLPSLGTLLVNALATADKVLIPVQTQKFSMDGLAALENLYEQIRDTINPNLSILGIMPAMTERTTVSKSAMKKLEEKYVELLFKTSISKSVEAQKSCENKVPLCITECRRGMEYAQLTSEILSRCRNNTNIAQ